MRGKSSEQPSMLCLISLESRVPSEHPLREIKKLADAALRELSPVFDAMYAEAGRASVPPERLLKSMLLIALYSVRSERQLCEQLEYNLLFRWFVDMNMLEPAFDASTFSTNRERLMEHKVATLFFATIQEQASELMSGEHFSVDGTLLEAWASMKSFRPKDDDDGDNNGWGDLRGQKRSNETHESRTDPEAKLMRKGNGREAKLSYAAHALMENRNGLLVALEVSEANGTCERETALSMLEEHAPSGATVGGDRGYDTRDFVERCRDAGVTTHVAQHQNERRRSAIDRRTRRHRGYAISQPIRKRTEQVFGWIKTVGGLRRTRFKGRARTQLAAYMVGAAYNLMRIAKLRRLAA
jgi:transposase